MNRLLKIGQRVDKLFFLWYNNMNSFGLLYLRKEIETGGIAWHNFLICTVICSVA